VGVVVEAMPRFIYTAAGVHIWKYLAAEGKEPMQGILGQRGKDEAVRTVRWCVSAYAIASVWKGRESQGPGPRTSTSSSPLNRQGAAGKGTGT
jgi:hypothetical protein